LKRAEKYVIFKCTGFIAGGRSIQFFIFGMTEKRRYIRFKAAFHFRYTLVDSILIDSSQDFFGVGEDINGSGMKMIFDRNWGLTLKAGNLLYFYLILPEKILEVCGKVMWTKGGDSGGKQELGVHFVDIPENYKEYIFYYISRYYPQETNQCKQPRRILH